MSHDPFDTLAAVYAVGALEGDERAEFEQHLADGCAICAATLRESQEALVGLARSATPIVPPAPIKEALRRRIAESEPARAPRPEAARRRWLPWAAGVAAVIAGAAFTGAFVAVRYEARLGQMARETARLREQVARNEAILRTELAVYRDAVDLFRDPATRIVELRGLAPRPGATGRLLWNETRGGQLFVTDLPAPPPGKAYEVWTIGDAGAAPRPAGMFTVDAGGRGGRRLDPVESGAPVKVFAITLEPEAGVPAPTGPMMLASK
jgi:anti-sigma-K factor RskA